MFGKYEIMDEVGDLTRAALQSSSAGLNDIAFQFIVSPLPPLFSSSLPQLSSSHSSSTLMPASIRSHNSRSRTIHVHLCSNLDSSFCCLSLARSNFFFGFSASCLVWASSSRFFFVQPHVFDLAVHADRPGCPPVLYMQFSVDSLYD